MCACVYVCIFVYFVNKDNVLFICYVGLFLLLYFSDRKIVLLLMIKYVHVCVS